MTNEHDLDALAWARKICAQVRPDHAEGFLSGKYDESSTEIKTALTALRSIAAPKQDAEVVEPTRWMYVSKLYTAYHTERLPERYPSHIWTETPLYAHPPAKPDAPAEPTGDAGVLALEREIRAHVEKHDTPKADDPRRRYTVAQLETAIRLTALRSRPASDVEALYKAAEDVLIHHSMGWEQDAPMDALRHAFEAIAALRGEKEKG